MSFDAASIEIDHPPQQRGPASGAASPSHGEAWTTQLNLLLESTGEGIFGIDNVVDRGIGTANVRAWAG